MNTSRTYGSQTQSTAHSGKNVTGSKKTKENIYQKTYGWIVFLVVLVCILAINLPLLGQSLKLRPRSPDYYYRNLYA
eukprot:Pgem_evm1s11476